jgi:ABC-type antimicrobial peptide transport system permease subunit
VKRWLTDAVYFLLKDMRHEWARTALTVLGMAVVIFSFFILSTFSQSLAFFNESESYGSNLIVIQSNLIDLGDSVLDDSALHAAEQMPSNLISRVSPVIFRHLRINDHLIQLRAARVEDWTTVFHMELLEGKWPKDFGEVAVGEGTAKANDWKIGSTVEIFGSEFRISAITLSPGLAFSSIWMPLNQAQVHFGKKNVYQMMVVQVAQNADAENVKLLLQTDPQLTGKYSVFFEDTYSQRNTKILKDMSSLMNICSSLALLAVTFGTYTSTNLSLTERGREIGILRAIGFPHNYLGKLLGLRAALQGFMAYTAGLAAALLFIAYRQAYAQVFVLGFNISFMMTWQIIFGGLLLTSTLALLGAWLSSRRLMHLSVNHMLKD